MAEEEVDVPAVRHAVISSRDLGDDKALSERIPLTLQLSLTVSLLCRSVRLMTERQAIPGAERKINRFALESGSSADPFSGLCEWLCCGSVTCDAARAEEKG